MRKWNLLFELRRRRILPVAGAYLAVGFLAVEITQFLLAQGDAPDWTSKLIAIAYVVGFPVSIFLAWVIQIDEDGVHRWDTSASEVRTVALAVFFGVTLTAILASLIIPGGTPKPGYEPFPNSIAVLPFETSGQTSNKSTIATTFHAVLLDGLDQSPELLSIPLGVPERPENVTTWVRQFRPEAVLLGDVFSSAGTTSIELRLLDVAGDTERWTTRIEWDATTTRETGIAIVNAILEAMGLSQVIAENISGTDSNEAYDAYVRGVEHFDVMNAKELATSIGLFEEAIAIDPSFVRAYSILASAQLAYTIMTGSQGAEGEAMIEKAIDAANKAVELDENAPAAISVLGRLTENRVIKKQLYERALELDPDHTITLMRYALQIAVPDGDLPRAEAMLRRVLEIEPYDANARSELAFLLFAMDRQDEALAQIERSIELQPDMPQNYMALGANSFFERGRIDSAIYFIRRAYAVNPEGGFFAIFIANGYAELGMTQEAHTWIDRAQALAPEGRQVQFHRAVAHRRLGEQERAAELYRQYDAKFGDQGIPPGAVYNLALLDIQDGRKEAGLERFRRLLPGLVAEDPQPTYENISLVFYYVRLLDEAGQPDVADVLYQRIGEFADTVCAEQNLEDCDLGWRYYARSKDRVRTLESVHRQIVVNKDRTNNFQFDDPRLDWLRDDPEFEQLMRILQDDIAQQRAWVIAKECTGGMPAAPGISSTIDCD